MPSVVLALVGAQTPQPVAFAVAAPHPAALVVVARARPVASLALIVADAAPVVLALLVAGEFVRQLAFGGHPAMPEPVVDEVGQ